MKLLTRVFILLVVFIFTINMGLAFGENIDFFGKTSFNPDSKQPVGARDFCITDEGLIIITDQEAGDVKIYKKDKNGLLLTKTLGGNGDGKNEFLEPTYCFCEKDRFGLIDFKKRRIFIYNISELKDSKDSLDFKLTHTIECPPLGNDFYLTGDKLFISGYTSDETYNSYELYCIDIKENRTSFLLPSHEKYGFDSLYEYRDEYLTKPDIRMIGLDGWFSIHGDDIFYVWEGDLRVVKLNIRFGPGKPITFGYKTKNYIKPHPSKNLRKFSFNSDPVGTREERRKMSYIRDIFANEGNVFLIFESPAKYGRGSNIWLQKYTFNGVFIDEVTIPEDPGRMFYFDRGNNFLYSLKKKANNNNKKYELLKYKINNTLRK